MKINLIALIVKKKLIGEENKMIETESCVSATKECAKCKIVKNKSEFYLKKDTKDGLKSACKVCVIKDAKLNYKNAAESRRSNAKKYRDFNKEKITAWRKKHYAENKDRINKKNREWAEKNPDKVKDRFLKSLYNISLDEYNLICIEQKHKCLICKQEAKLVVDHCHNTGKIRGLLCGKCNIGIGQFDENEEFLRGAIEYLKIRR